MTAVRKSIHFPQKRAVPTGKSRVRFASSAEDDGGAEGDGGGGLWTQEDPVMTLGSEAEIEMALRGDHGHAADGEDATAGTVNPMREEQGQRDPEV